MIGVMATLSRILSIVIVTLLSGCGETKPVETSLAALAESQVHFNGRLVRVSGTLRTFDEPRHYWIENEDLDRVALEGRDDLAARVGQDVEVVGTFKYSRNTGRKIEVRQLTQVE